MKNSPRSAINYIIFTVLFSFATIMIFKSNLSSYPGDIALPTGTDSGRNVQIVIDPGHGGEDGGASVENVLEKDINLSVALTLNDLYTIFGYDAILTRTDDRMLYDHFGDLSDYTGKKKTYDLKNRLRIAEESGASLFVGIHMNKFPIEKYSGLQTYYSPNSKESSNVANIIQSYSKKYLQAENKREIKAATDAIYILKRIQLPSVLVECGFLSNNAERELLVTPEYQKKLASVIFSASAEFISSEK